MMTVAGAYCCVPPVDPQEICDTIVLRVLPAKGWQAVTPDESRALGMFLNKYPARTTAVMSGGWQALTLEERDAAESMFKMRWGRPVRHAPPR